MTCPKGADRGMVNTVTFLILVLQFSLLEKPMQRSDLPARKPAKGRPVDQ